MTAAVPTSGAGTSTASEPNPVRLTWLRSEVLLPSLLSVLAALVGAALGGYISFLATKDTIRAEQRQTVLQLEVQQRIDLRPMKRAAYKQLLARTDAVLYDYERLYRDCLARGD